MHAPVQFNIAALSVFCAAMAMVADCLAFDGCRVDCATCRRFPRRMWLMLLTENFMRFVRVGFQWLTAGRLSVIGLVVLGSAVGLPAYTLAASTSNARSPLGINLIQMNYY